MVPVTASAGHPRTGCGDNAGAVVLVLGRHQDDGTDNVKGCHHMNGHDPILILLILILVGLTVGYVNHHWPTIGASIDVAGKVLLVVIGILVFTGTAASPPQTAVPAPAPSMTAPAKPGSPDGAAAPAPSTTAPENPPRN